MIDSHTKVVSVSPQNRVKTVTPLKDGRMKVEFHSGHTTKLAANDELIQAFVVYSVLAEL